LSSLIANYIHKITQNEIQTYKKRGTKSTKNPKQKKTRVQITSREMRTNKRKKRRSTRKGSKKQLHTPPRLRLTTTHHFNGYNIK
jgi:hypothetical protein